MPISDLLASITGEKPAAPASAPPTPVSVPKRKADNELTGSAAKTPRTSSTTNGAARPNGSQNEPSSTSRLPDRPLASSSTNPKPVSAPRPSDKNGNSTITKNAQNTPSKGPSSSLSTGNRPPATTSAANSTVAVDSGQKQAPKKGTFLEVMARGAKNQATMPVNKIGTIQHKPMEKGMTKRERIQSRASDPQFAARARLSAARHGGSAISDSSRHTNKASSSAKPTNGKAANGASGKSLPVTEVKKVKKAALATTGYTGTARPVPGARVKPNGSSSKPGGGTRPGERPRYGGPLVSGSRRRYEDDDDDLDDFIEYDDEEEEPGYGIGPPRAGGYESLEEDESDMEAGLTDVEEEERRAEAAARREDRLQEELERKLKREKEERKRKLMESAKRRA